MVAPGGVGEGRRRAERRVVDPGRRGLSARRSPRRLVAGVDDRRAPLLLGSKGHRFPRAITAYAVTVYLRFALSLRDAEELLAERAVIVSYETIRIRVARLAHQFAAPIRRDRPRSRDKWHLDEVVVRIGGRTHWLWRAVKPAVKRSTFSCATPGY